MSHHAVSALISMYTLTGHKCTFFGRRVATGIVRKRTANYLVSVASFIKGNDFPTGENIGY